MGVGISVQSFADDTSPNLVRAEADHVFLPTGFDSNDNVQIVFTGNLMDTCYKAAPAKVDVNLSDRVISLTPQAYHYTQGWCLRVLVPYTQTADLGILPAGTYQVVTKDLFGNATRTKTLTVGVANSANPDEFLYMPVKNAVVVPKPDAPSVVLVGSYPNSCMFLQNVRVIHRSSDVVEVLPVAGYRPGICMGSPRPFSIKVPLPKLERGQALVHVRALNGQAINQVEDFQ
jgi:hypothetical protein